MQFKLTSYQGRIQEGAVRGAPPPLYFLILKRESHLLSLTPAIEKETKKMKERNI